MSDGEPGGQSEVPNGEAGGRTGPERGTLLLTGATGFVGSHVAAALAAHPSPVRCTIRESSDTRWLDSLDVAMVVADVTDPEAVRTALEGVDVVIHGAGVTKAPDRDTYFRVNTEGTLVFAKAAAAAGVRRFIFISSLAARGPDPDGGGPPRERTDSPESAYGMSKLAAEERLSAFREQMNVIVLRPGGVYGPRDIDLLPLFRMARTGRLVVPREETRLQPVYAGDVAEAVTCALHAQAGPGPYPVMGEGRYSWMEVAEALEEAMGQSLSVYRVPSKLLVAGAAVLEGVARVTKRPPALDRRRARDLALRRWTADPAPTMRALEWRPRVPLPLGLRHTVRWYRDRGWL